MWTTFFTIAFVIAVALNFAAIITNTISNFRL